MKHIDLERVPPAARPSIQRFIDLFKDEPWLFGFPIGGETAFLEPLGLELGELLTLGSEESIGRYLTRADGTTVGAEAHAKAQALRTAAQAYAAAKMSAEEKQAHEQRMREQQAQMAYRIAEAFVRPG
jgi:hypothetical protein